MSEDHHGVKPPAGHRRLVLSHRRAGALDRASYQRAKARMYQLRDALQRVGRELSAHDPDDHQRRSHFRFDVPEHEVEALLRAVPPEVILEEEVMHELSALAVTVQNASDHQPVAGVPGTLYFSNNTNEKATSGADGKLSFVAAGPGPTTLVLEPRQKFWSNVVAGPANNSVATVLPLTPSDDKAMGWWHTLARIKNYDLTLGQGIKVAVIDSGVGPNAYLAQVQDLGAFIGGHHITTPGAGQDSGNHGTHVAGIIGAQPPCEAGPYVGIAPGVTLLGARVFPPGAGAASGDIAAAIDDAADKAGANLINLSLGSAIPAQVTQDAVAAAAERGCLIVAAAGNSSNAVNFPAAYADCVAVGALGLTSGAPAGTSSHLKIPPALDKGRYGDNTRKDNFAPAFSCFGKGVDCVGAGVGIISTGPATPDNPKPYIAMDGTSMASPWVCGILAILLATDSQYTSAKSGKDRVARARRIFDTAVFTTLGFDKNYEGRGALGLDPFAGLYEEAKKKFGVQA